MYAVILAGESGTRLRPLRTSGDHVPFRTMPDGRTLLQHTAARLGGLVDPMDVVVVADRRHGQLVREQLPEARILNEPMNRSTAASLALATVAVGRPEGETMVVMTADHAVERADVLRDALEAVEAHVVRGAAGVERPLLTFGVPPTGPDPEFSYLQPRYDDGVRAGGLRVFPVLSFEPKPVDGRARELFATGSTYWSSGIFAWQRGAIRDAIGRYTPLLTLLEPAHRSELALRAAYDRLQPMSIEEAVLLGAAGDGLVLTAPLDAGWRNLAD